MASQHVSVKQAFGLSVGSEIILRGWVRSRRDSKGITFIEINDGSRFKSMQLVVDAGIVPDETLKQVTTGSSISATGVLVESPAKGQAVELKVASIHVYGSADPGPLSAAEERTYARVSARDLAPAGAQQHLRRRLSRAERTDPCDPQFFSGARFYLCADADHHDLGLRRRRPDVRRDHAELAATAAYCPRARSIGNRIFSPNRLISP